MAAASRLVLAMTRKVPYFIDTVVEIRVIFAKEFARVAARWVDNDNAVVVVVLTGVFE